MKRIKQKYGLLIIGIIVGVLYGLITRYKFGQEATLASITYLFLVPAILGVIPLIFADNEQLKSYRNTIFIPWITFGVFFISLLKSGVEELLCLLILATPFIILGTVGAFIFRYYQIKRKRNRGKLLCLIFLPFVISPLEQYLSSPSKKYTVLAEVAVNAFPEEVWDQIVEVKEIQLGEYKTGAFNSLGIPRPISALVNKKEVGGQRIGNFEGGLRFIESIIVYEINKKISFDIKVDSFSVGKRVFDQHVLKGNYFSFVNATYEIERLKNGGVNLKLSSSYQLTSKVNFYGKFWGDIILKDFQSRLLLVIKKRCENKPKKSTTGI